MKRKNTSVILKGSEVKLQGTCKIDIGPLGSASVQASEAGTHGVVPQEVRVVETHSDYAIIEFVCSCGGKSQVRCDYGQAAAAEQGDSQETK